MARIVTLITDFGTADGYAGEMKGVVLSAVPDATLVDITHDISPQDVTMARMALARVWRRFPAGTIHLVVVDPGVGSSRAAIAVASAGQFLVGPDNGVLSPGLCIPGARTVNLPIPAAASATFHGRDVFAPAVVKLARGAALDSLGVAVSTPMIVRTPPPTRNRDGSVAGEVVLIDRFGNAITNLSGARDGNVEVSRRVLKVEHTYASTIPGELLALVGSTGMIEIAVRDGSAAASLGIGRGTAVVFRAAPLESPPPR